MAPVDSRDYVLCMYSVLEPRRCAKHNVACQHSEQTRDVHPMPVQCWPAVSYAGPSIKRAVVQRLVFADSSWSGSAGSASPVLASIHSALVSTSCVHIPSFGRAVTGNAADSAMEVSVYFTSVHITEGITEGRAVTGKKERSDASEKEVYT